MELTRALDVQGTAQRIRVDRDAGVLVGSRCEGCGATSWPARAICHRCGRAGMEQWRFSAQGTLLTHTEVWTPRPGLEVPYRLGQVQVTDGPAVFCHIRELVPGRPVPLPVHVVLADDEASVPPFWFEPDEEEQ
jgi:uncharacterized OB-fold protein